MVKNYLCQFYENKTDLSLRYRLISKKSYNSYKSYAPEILPPTAMFHSYRTYHQTQVWMAKKMDPLCWGYFIHKGRMMPVTMKQASAPPKLLKVVRCGCKTGCKTMTCSCRKHGKC